ncbi:UNVERIFIED_CONTAM: hypothetical protein FKN15_007640 [Acipenser sinensis]
MLSAVLFTLQADSEASQTCRVGGNTVLPANRSQLTGARSPQESLVQCSALLQYNLPSGIGNLAGCNPFQSANQPQRIKARGEALDSRGSAAAAVASRGSAAAVVAWGLRGSCFAWGCQGSCFAWGRYTVARVPRRGAAGHEELGGAGPHTMATPMDTVLPPPLGLRLRGEVAI